jgi:uncharacterized protein (DUF305 family)
MRLRRTALAATAVALMLVLAGCTASGMQGMDHGSDEPTTGSNVDAAFNAADEAFVVGMIPHHEQAVEMAEMLLAKDGVDARVIALAERIRDAQQPEIDLMTGWLDDWGVDADMGGMEGMDHGDDGMMSDDDMSALDDASGPDASALFLEQMIEHHRGAIEMAEQELSAGENVDALDLAQQIIDDQTAEIAEMQGLLAEI